MDAGTVVVKLVLDDSGFSSGLDGASGKADNLAASMGKVLGGAAALGIFKSVAGSIISAGSAMETTRVAFQTFTGSVEKGNKVLKELNKFSNITPFNNKEVIAAGKTLLAFNAQGEDLTGTLELIGNVAAGTGKNFTELSVIYGKAMSKGIVQGEELNQLTEAGVPILKVLSEQFGVTAGQVRKMGSDGKITGEHLTKAFETMSAEGGQFNKMMEKQSQTFGGLVSTIAGKFGAALATLGETINKSLKPALIAVLAIWDSMGEDGQEFVFLFGAIAGGVALLSIAFYALTPAVLIAGKALWLALAPIMPIIAAVAVLAAGVAFLVVKWDEIDKAMGGFENVIRPISDAFLDIKNSIEKMVDTSSIKDFFSQFGNGSEDLDFVRIAVKGIAREVILAVSDFEQMMHAINTTAIVSANAMNMLKNIASFNAKEAQKNENAITEAFKIHNKKSEQMAVWTANKIARLNKRLWTKTIPKNAGEGGKKAAAEFKKKLGGNTGFSHKSMLDIIGGEGVAGGAGALFAKVFSSSAKKNLESAGSAIGSALSKITNTAFSTFMDMAEDSNTIIQNSAKQKLNLIGVFSKVLKKQSQEEIDIVTKTNAIIINAIITRNKAELDAIDELNSAKLAALDEEIEKELESLDRLRDENMSALESAYEEELSNLQRLEDEKFNIINDAHNERSELLDSELQSEIDRIDSEIAYEREQLIASNEEKREQLENESANEYERRVNDAILRKDLLDTMETLDGSREERIAEAQRIIEAKRKEEEILTQQELTAATEEAEAAKAKAIKEAEETKSVALESAENRRAAAVESGEARRASALEAAENRRTSAVVAGQEKRLAAEKDRDDKLLKLKTEQEKKDKQFAKVSALIKYGADLAAFKSSQTMQRAQAQMAYGSSLMSAVQAGAAMTAATLGFGAPVAFALTATLTALSTGAFMSSMGAINSAIPPMPPVGVFLAQGGVLSGPGTTTSDSIPARLSTRESVIDAPRTAKLFNAIDGGGFGGKSVVVNIESGAFQGTGEMTDETIEYFSEQIARRVEARI